MKTELWNLLATVLSGVLVYVISQWYTEFILRPIQEYKRLKAKTANLLILHAQYYANPQIYGDGGDFSVRFAASTEIRELAAEVAAFAEVKPFHPFVFCAIPTKKSLSKASRCLIGLSNSFFTTRARENVCFDCAIDYPEIIKKHMWIACSRKKKRGD